MSHVDGFSEAVTTARVPHHGASRSEVRPAEERLSHTAARRRWRPWNAAGLSLLLLAGCASRQLPCAAPTLSQPTATAPYFLQVGDVLSVKFYYNPELDEDVLVRPDGMISLQLIGDVPAAGRTPSLLAADLTTRYTGELATPKINVIVRQLGGARVYVGGEVGTQGVIPLSGGLTLFQAIQEAGGLLKTAHRAQVVLIRRNGSGAPVGYTIDLRPVASGEQPERDVALQPFDIVHVPRSAIANVNLFVEQYVRNVLPITPGLGLVP